MTYLILASSSAARKMILSNVGVDFLTEAASIDEAEVKASYRRAGQTPSELALALAELKALRVSARYPDALVIGADQILVCGDVWFDKPPDLDHARAQLMALRGKTHQLVTAVVTMRDGIRLWHDIVISRLTMRVFSDSFLSSYIEKSGDEILDSVGSYKIEGFGAQLFSKIEGDYFSIIGLPLFSLLDHLRQQDMITR